MNVITETGSVGQMEKPSPGSYQHVKRLLYRPDHSISGQSM
jgi:hypothetical protein